MRDRRIHAPGDLEAELEARHRAAGIPLSAKTLNGVIHAARALRADATPIDA